MSIRKIVTGFLVCAVIVSSTSFLNGAQIVIATSTNDPAQTPKDVTSLCVRITPTEEPMPTPLADPFIQFVDGENTRTEIGSSQIEGYTTYLIVKMIEPYKKKEGYRFLGWKNNCGLYQPGDEVKVCGKGGYIFYAKWKRIETKKASLKIVTKANKQFIVGKKYRIKVKRSNTNKKIKWSVSNKKVAAINKKTGVLKAKKVGTVTITVTCGSLKRKIRIRIS